MKIRYLALACSALAAGISTASAVAQTQIPVETDATFRTELMPLGFAPDIAGFTRTEVVGYDQEQFDVAANFNHAETSTFATLFVYRAGIEDPRIWGDRAETVMLASKSLGEIDHERIVRGTFTPPNGSGEESGLRLAVSLDESDWVSSGLSLFMHDGWLIKVRMSSRTLERDQLLVRMDEFTRALVMERASEVFPAFTPVQDCEKELSFKREAKLVRLDMMGSLIYGAAFKAVEEKQQGNTGDPASRPVACRAQLGESYAVYVHGTDEESYMMALGDAGISASIARYDMDKLMTPGRGYAVILANGVEKEILPPFDRLPRPEQVLAIIGKVGPVVTVDTRPGSDGGTTISVPTGK